MLRSRSSCHRRLAAVTPITTTDSLLQLPLAKNTSCGGAIAGTPSSDDVAELISRQKSAALCLRTFRWALRLPSFTPTPSLYRALIRSLLSFRRLDAVVQVLSDLPSPPDDLVLVALFRSLGRARMTHHALQLLDEMTDRFNLPNPPSLKVLNAILNLLVEENIDLARRFFRKRMNARGDDHTFGILMKGLCRTNRIADGFKLLALMKTSDLKPNPVIYNTLIHALCRLGKVWRARSLLAQMDSPSVVTFNILISAYCGQGCLLEALVTLEKSFDFGFVPDAISVTKLVNLLCSHDRAREAMEILERVEERGGIVDAVAYNTLIKGLCNVAKPEAGRRVMREMERKGCLPNLQTYNALISGFSDLEKMDSAMDLFREMEIVGISPEFSTYNMLIGGFCSLGRVGDGLMLLNLMEEQRGGIDNNINPYNSIFYGYYREGRLEEAVEFLHTRVETFFPRAKQRSLRILGFCKEDRIAEALVVYEEMVKEGGFPNVLIYVSLIQGLCQQGDVRKAFDLMNAMMEKKFFPRASTFNCLIHWFCNAGMFVSASKLLNEMWDRKCSPNASSYSPLICLLCEIGELEKASGFLVKMVERGVIPDYCIWKCLLFSDLLWNKFENTIMIEEIITICL